MKKFYLPEKDKVFDIIYYRSEYDGKMKCEDERCRVPIKYVPGNIKGAYFRVSPSYEHNSKCEAKSKNKKNKARNKINYIIGVPVLNLNIPPIDLSSVGLNTRKIKRKYTRKKQPNEKSIVSIKREYLKDTKGIGRFISKNFDKWDDYNVLLGGKEIKLNSVVMRVDKVLSKKTSLNNKETFVLGQISKIGETSMGGHLTIVISDNENNSIRIFIDKKLQFVLSNRVKEGKCILVRGIFTKEYNNQIILNSKDDLHILNSRCKLY